MKRGWGSIFALFAVFVLAAIPLLATLPARMTGGGSVGMLEDNPGFRITHGFQLYCEPGAGLNTLEVNWGGHHFHLETVIRNQCVASPPDPAPPSAPIFRMDGSGTGRYDGLPGCSITYSLTDLGEPGTKDEAFFVITCPDLGTVLSGGGVLTFGNQQAFGPRP